MLAIPGAEGMFSLIQAALVKAGSSNRIKVDRSTRDKLRDWIGWQGTSQPGPPPSPRWCVTTRPSGKQPTPLNLEWGV